MTLSESGYEHSSVPERGTEIAACQAGVQAELGELSYDIAQTDALPSVVTDYMTSNVSERALFFAQNEAASLQRKNPDIFKVHAGVLPILMKPILERAEIAARNERIQAKETENAEKKNELGRINTNIEVLSDEVQLEEIAKTDPSLKDLAGRTLIEALYRLGFVRERPELQERLKMISGKLDAIQSVAASPLEAATLETIIGQSVLYFGANAPADIFADVLARTDASGELSESTKAKVHELFKIPTVKTAGDVQMVLNQGYGIGADGERMPFTKDNKARVFENTYVYETPTGERRFQVNLPDGRNLNIAFDGQTDNQILGDLIYTTQIIFEMEQMSLAEPIFQRGWDITHGGNIDLHFDDIITAKRIGAAFLGGMSGHSARLLSESDQSRMGHSFQAFPRKGDAAHADNNSDRALTEYQELTIVNEDGTINWTRFEKAALYLQGVTAKGGQPNFEDLKTYLISHPGDESAT